VAKSVRQGEDTKQEWGNPQDSYSKHIDSTHTHTHTKERERKKRERSLPNPKQINSTDVTFLED
jgi:hypothetical protein